MSSLLPLMAVCSPLAADRLTLRPTALSGVRIVSGPWAQWQAANRRATIPHGLTWLERDGVIDNFRRLIGESAAPERRGWVFCDSDLYKVLEGIAWDLSLAPNTEWNQVVKDAAALLARTQEEDGYLNTFVQAGLEKRFGNLPRGHELYCAGHLIQAAVAYSRVTGDDCLLDIAHPFADYLVEAFIGGHRNDTDGHPEIETALVELYRHTGRDSYLSLARQLIDVRGHGALGPGLFGSTYFQDDVPVRDQTSTVGHAVRALYLLAGVVDVYLETGEEALLESAERQWASMVAEKTYLTGAVGSRFEGEAFGDPYELPPDLIYGETCASIGAFMASWRLLLATGAGKYADLMERILYNVLAASTSLERTEFFYVNPMQRRRARPSAPRGAKPLRTDAPGTRAEWFDVACCPPNIMRTIASLGGYLATTTEDGVQLQQYVPAELAVEIGSGQVTIEVVTEYPREGRVKVTVTTTSDAVWELALRIPAWAGDRATVTVQGRTVPAATDGSGYHRIRARWTDGAVIIIELPVAPRLTLPHPAVDAVRGCVAIERGPVVYCLEQPADDSARLPGENTDLAAVVLPADAQLTEEWVDGILGGTVAVHAQGLVRDDTVWADSGWMDSSSCPQRRTTPARLSAIPYALWANRGPSEMRVWIPTS